MSEKMLVTQALYERDLLVKKISDPAPRNRVTLQIENIPILIKLGC